MWRYLATALVGTLILCGTVRAQDDNGDQKPTAEQTQDAATGDSRFQTLDTDLPKGKLSLSEYTAGLKGQAHEAAVSKFATLNTEKDAFLTPEEFSAGQTNWTDVLLYAIVILAIVALPFVVGGYLSRMLRMPEYSVKLGVIAFAVTVGFVLVIGGWPPQLGPDLRGGVILVYEIDKEKRISDVRPRVVSDIAVAIGVDQDDRVTVFDGEGNQIEVRLPADRRADVVATIDALDFNKYDAQITKIADRRSADSVRLVYAMTLDDYQPAIMRRIVDKISADKNDRLSVSAGGENLIDVKMPSDSRDDVVAQINEMEFGGFGAVLEESATDKQGDDIVVTFEIKVDAQDVKMDGLISEITRRINPGGIKEVAVRKRGNEQVEIIIPGESDVELIKKRLGQAGVLKFRIVPNMASDNSTGLYERALKAKGNTVYRGEIEEARWVKLGDGVRSDGMMKRIGKKDQEEVLILLDAFDVVGADLKRATAGFDDRTLSPAVFFTMNASGASKFGKFTSSNLKRSLGIVLDGELFSSATIQSRIDGNGQITGDFSQERVEFVVGILNAGQLSAELNKQPISEERIGPQLGEATVKAATYAMSLSMAVVLVFMLIYYRFAGVLACLALSLNILLVLAIMIAVGYEFTLAGLAGLVLTVGMAVDANVLIFERIREETNRGAALRMAIRNGFSKATTTIVDANLTTLITAIVLFWIGTEQVKGFAVTLILGITMSMFTAIFCSRVIFDIAERKKFITKLGMMRLIGATSIDFIGKRFTAASVSLVLIAVGLVATYQRGKNLLDIDFTGGSAVTIYFEAKEPMPVAEVRETMAKSGLPDVQVSRIQFEDEDDDLRYKIDTSDRNLREVKKTLRQTFGDRLRTIHMQHKNLVAVAIEKPAVTLPPFDFDKLPKDDQPKDDKPKDDKPTDDKPTDDKPKDDKPKDDKPAEPKTDDTHVPADKTPADKTPADKPAGDDTAPKDDEKAGAEEPKPADGASRATIPHLSLPFAAVSQLALLQVDDADPPSTDAPGDQPKDDTDEPAGEPGAPKDTDDPKDAEPPKDGEDDPKDAPPKDGADQPKEPGTKPDGDLPPVPEDTGAVPPPIGVNPFSQPQGAKSTVKLSFSEKISSPSLMEVVARASEGITGIEEGQLNVEFTNAKYSIGSSIGYKDWEMEANLDVATAQKLLDAMTKELAETPIFPSTSNIGERVSGDMKWKAISALLVSLLFIVAYIWIRFQSVVFGLAAVVALVHDVLITLGCLAISAYVAPYLGFMQIEPFKISLPIVAAFLTIIGYSLNDTIVVFDRIREVRGKSPDLTADVVNTSINQTLSRTLLTSITTLIVVTILFFFGGPGIHAFAFSLVVGVMVGTYSSVFIASPALLAMMHFREKEGAATRSGSARSLKTT